MVIAGGATSGYCATGMLGMANSPASRMNRETTQAKIGRSIKNCGMWADSESAHENRHAALCAACRSGFLPRGRLLGRRPFAWGLACVGGLAAGRRRGLARRAGVPRGSLRRRAGPDLLEALDHDTSPALRPLVMSHWLSMTPPVVTATCSILLSLTSIR